MNPKPALATEWSISPDGKTYNFKLRPSVKFHDGKPFTAADVAYPIQLLKTVHPRGRNTFANMAEVQTPTAVFVLSKPTPYLIKALAAATTRNSRWERIRMAAMYQVSAGPTSISSSPL